jgi:uncharacterized protein (DUF58 family)
MMTQRAALLGFVAFCFYLVAVVNTLPSFYFTLTWLSGGIFGASFGIALLSLVGLECQIKVKNALGSAAVGEPTSRAPSLFLALQNRGTLNKTSLILELRFLDSRNEIQAHRFVIESVPSGTSIEADLPLFHLPRGTYQIQQARIVNSDVLGLFRVQKRLVLEENMAEIVVGPAILRVENGVNSDGRGADLGSRRTIRNGGGEELRGTRPYAPGDDLRHVHWKSSARAGELVVKEWEQMERETVLVVWDGAQNTSWGSREWDSTEWGLILTASLCHTLLSSATPCALARCDIQPLVYESRTLVGSELPLPMISALAQGFAERKTSLKKALASFPSLLARHYSTVIVVSSSLDSDLVEFAQLCQARAIRIRVILINGASLGERSKDRRFRGRTSLPSQNNGGQSSLVSSENYEIQGQKLRAAGAHVVLIKASDELPETLMSRALREVFGNSKSAFRTDREEASSKSS